MRLRKSGLVALLCGGALSGGLIAQPIGLEEIFEPNWLLQEEGK